jgi:hypothetical protein
MLISCELKRVFRGKYFGFSIARLSPCFVTEPFGIKSVSKLRGKTDLHRPVRRNVTELALTKLLYLGQETIAMFHKQKQLQQAAQKAKELVETLQKRNPDSEQWNYRKMEGDLKEAYYVLKHAWHEGKSVETVKNFLSAEGYALLNSDSKLGNVDAKYLDLLDCFDAELDDIAIISVINLPGESEDYFVAWLDNEYHSEHKLDDLKANEVNSFGLGDALPNFSGLNLWNIVKMAPNDCWTFKWSPSEHRWVLHNITFDNMTNSYLQVLGKSLDLADDQQFN